MRITVKLNSIDITIDRPNFREGNQEYHEEMNMRVVIIPTLDEACKRVKELHKINIKDHE